VLTAHQLEQRKGKITASLVPAICGLDPWKGPVQAYLEITGRKVEEAEGENLAAELGSLLEEPIIRLTERKTGRKIRRRNIWRVLQDGPLAGKVGATLDCDYDVDTDYGEIKTNGVLSGFGINSGWGEEGTDEVPEKVHIQIAAQMLVCPEKQLCIVPALVGRKNGLTIYKVHRNKDLVEAVGDRIARFWRDHIEPDVMPPLEQPADAEYITELTRSLPVRTEPVAIDPALCMEYDNFRAMEKAGEEGKKIAAAKIKLALNGAEIGTASGFKVSCKRPKDSLVFDRETFEAEQPELFSRYTVARPNSPRLLVTAEKKAVTT
jgi:predicted phage-related endonuclease